MHIPKIHRLEESRKLSSVLELKRHLGLHDIEKVDYKTGQLGIIKYRKHS